MLTPCQKKHWIGWERHNKNGISDTTAETFWWHPPTPLTFTKPNPDICAVVIVFVDAMEEMGSGFQVSLLH